MFRAIRDWWRKREYYLWREWAHVPPPEWAAKRGGRDYW